SGFALGGLGSGIAKNMDELQTIAKKALSFAPQILVEQYLHHFKEVEYEVVRDKDDNCITVCNMENMDPLGIHTGESIVVAPSQTLTNAEYHGLRLAAIKIVRSLNIVGECNVQFALDPKKFEYFVIEVNARLSRSSALASKATGYPLAYIAAKLALGYSLPKLENKVTGVTKACFEPSLDYLVVKIPRWDIEKFKNADTKIGSSMKSVGEVMGIGRTFEEAYQKAIRMLDLDYDGATSEKIFTNINNLEENLRVPTPKRMFAIARALKHTMPMKKIYELTGIDPWFLSRIKNIVEKEETLKKSKKLTSKVLQTLKELGFSDKKIGELVGIRGREVRELRKKYNILPFVFQIDTLAAEFPAQTNYLYMSYNAAHNDVRPTGKEGVIVLGSGPYRIGSSVEFDWTNVTTVMALKTYKKKSIVINCNPETVSTDYDISDRLYFEELTFERITDIYEFEKVSGVIVSVGGQTPNNRVRSLHSFGVNILGTNPEHIDMAEDRSKFSKLLDDLQIKQPVWRKFSHLSDAESFAEKVGYPVLIRPSYVLSGSAMNICYSKYDLAEFIEEAAVISTKYPITVSKFFEKTKEIEFDAIAQHGQVKAFVISEHIENAGVHSGDATVVLPTQTVNDETKAKIEDVGRKLAKALMVTGPFNIQFLAKDNEA
ncbi:MAG: carbamoyl-phosphate synthase large subunit, partial [Candidatus Levyibacteriota bacterium]